MKYLSESEIVSASVEIETPKCGIYFLIADGKIMYVGQSVEVDVRVGVHRRAGRVFDRWHWIPCQPESLDELERFYIDQFLPPWNSDRRTALMRGDFRMPSSPLPANPWENMPQIPPEDAEEMRAIAEEEYQERRERMLRVRAMRGIPRIYDTGAE